MTLTYLLAPEAVAGACSWPITLTARMTRTVFLSSTFGYADSPEGMLSMFRTPTDPNDGSDWM